MVLDLTSISSIELYRRHVFKCLPLGLLLASSQSFALAVSETSEQQDQFDRDRVAVQQMGVLAPDLPSAPERLQYRYLDLSLPQQDLLFANFSRPGQSAEIYDAGGSYRARVFSHENSAPMSFAVAPAPGTPSEMNYGGTLQLNLADPLQLDMGYIGGRLQWDDEDQLFNPQPTQAANSWNMAVNSYWFDRSIRTRVEYAESQYLKQNSKLDAEVMPGQAMLAEVSLSSDGVLPSGWFDRWSGKARYQSVDTGYYSLANLGLAKGVETTQLLLQSQSYGVGMDLEWKQEGYGNKELMRFEPTSDRAGVRLQYQLDQGFLPLPGTPTLAARYYRVNQWQTRDLVLNQGYERLVQGDEAGLNLNLQNQQWRCSIDFMVADQTQIQQWLPSADTSYNNDESDWRNEVAQFNLGWVPAAWFDINLNAVWNQRVELIPDNRYKNRNLGVQARALALPRNLRFHMEYYFGDQASDSGETGSLETRFMSRRGNAQLTWQAQPDSGRHPALDVYLRSTVTRQFDIAADVDALQWTALVGFDLYWQQQ